MYCLLRQMLPVSLDCYSLLPLRSSLMYIYYSLSGIVSNVTSISSLYILLLRFSLMFIYYSQSFFCVQYLLIIHSWLPVWCSIMYNAYNLSCLLCPLLPVYIDFPFVIAPAVFSNIYLIRYVLTYHTVCRASWYSMC